MDEVEQVVLGGLQKHLNAPHLLREFAEAYQEERQRLASKRIKRRSQVENELAQLQRSIDRVWEDYLRERISGDVAGPKLNELKSQQKALETERADLPVEEKAVGLHPTALQHYEMLVTDLQSVFGEGLTEANEEAAERIRNLVAKVTVEPTDDGFSIELQGRLALLMGVPDLYPSMRLAASGGSMVAEEGFVPPIHGLKSDGTNVAYRLRAFVPLPDRSGIRLLSAAASPNFVATRPPERKLAGANSCRSTLLHKATSCRLRGSQEMAHAGQPYARRAEMTSKAHWLDGLSKSTLNQTNGWVF